MAEHTIEDLVEDTVLLIDQASWSASLKRDYLASAFNIQRYFDTGYTHFRVMDILLKYGFVYRISLDRHADFATIKNVEDGWIKSEHTGEPSYAKHEDGQIYLYIDAGDQNWQRLCEEQQLHGPACVAPSIVKVHEFLAEILEEAERKNQYELLLRWYAFFVYEFLQEAFPENDPAENNFINIVGSLPMLSIREIAERNRVNAPNVRLPRLADEIRLAENIDKEYVARFFLDWKKSPAALKTSFEKALDKQAKGSSIVGELIDGQLKEMLQAQQWIYVPQEKENTRCWYKDLSEGRLFVWIALETEDKFLMCQLGLQHRLLLKWQQRAADLQLPHLHFYKMAISALPEEQQDDTKIFHPLGGWNFDLGKSRKALQKQLVHLIQTIGLSEKSFVGQINKEFPENFFKRAPESLIKLIEEGEDNTGIIPEYVLFGSPHAILLSFAYHYLDQAKIKEAYATIDMLRHRVQAKTRLSAYETMYLQAFLAGENEDVLKRPMPPVYHALLLKA